MPKQIKEKKKKIFFGITTNGFLFLKIFAIALMLLGIFADAFYFSLAIPDNLYFYFKIFSYASFPIFLFCSLKFFTIQKEKLYIF